MTPLRKIEVKFGSRVLGRISAQRQEIALLIREELSAARHCEEHSDEAISTERDGHEIASLYSQ
jgi:hypothetical protein